ncbi:DUF1338 domain-containing protein [Chitinophaga sp. Cy-1792]|uniref:DUF1338 domain-containing protein n=1 Tax=Chitinophaga sp. Cy-1792 TaxID=2608339 RepID=UPI00142158FA|nr:DUF1338 domain-containing protein [Chitinophaga sp. Cy-1792]NIG56247.1 DUF1338 domain-containing protein [Chitinophaga sp. Cy-1792]
MNKLELILEGLMRRYRERVPDVNRVLSAMIADGLIKDAQEIENDHIAFRTIGVPHLGIQSLEKIFIYHGYTKRDYLYFEEKKLDAYWYAPPDPALPRIFISELRVGDLSEKAQQIIHSYTDEVTADPVDTLDLDNPDQVDVFLHSGLWRLPTYADFSALAAESEYASWTIYNRYYLNHFTISVHNLKEGYNHIEAYNQFLEKHGLQLNDAGGKFKKSPDGLLLQSSTVAGMIAANFADGVVHRISGSYVEFAERRLLPEYQQLPQVSVKREHRRDGFEAANANKIFESTYSSQTNK